MRRAAVALAALPGDAKEPAALPGAACVLSVLTDYDRVNFLFSVELAPLKRADVLEPEMQQRLLHGLQSENQMDVRVSAKKAELAELERLVAEERRLLEETAHRRKEEQRRLEELGANVYRPRLVDPRAIRRKTLILAFDGLLVSIRTSAARDVLIVEDEVAKIGCNNLMNDLVPRRWDLSVETSSSSFLIDHLLPYLTTWRSSMKGTVEFVEETRPWATLPWVEEPVEALMKWWGPDVKKTKTWTDILFRSCTYEERKSLREIWTSITIRQKSRVESAAPVESTTPVLSAALVAIDQPSAPISSVVDVTSVPSTS
ncbi:hypothetical protein R1sor_007862 [Riccia sorocarpa]|uniref:Uncharacterized protein n=1 Tax=Riccia sorocarpa TaxID=122646 RepID=A0ABD3HVU8_9MARC